LIYSINKSFDYITTVPSKIRRCDMTYSHVSIYNLSLYIFSKLTCFEKTAMSSLKLSDEQTSPPATPGSRGVHVANSHFSNMSARSGNKGCLKEEMKECA